MNHFNKLILLFCPLTIITTQLTACGQRAADGGNKIYIDSRSGNDDNNGHSSSKPWKTLKNIATATLKAGDSLFFARGSSYTGGLQLKMSGKPGVPIVFTSYGSGKKPSFTNNDYNDHNGNVFQISGSHIAIDGLLFYHTSNYPGKATSANNTKGEDRKILLTGAVYQVTEASHLTVINCEFEDSPIGVYVNGKNNLISKNYFHDCNRFLWEPDWGPMAVVIGNAGNEVSYNVCVNYVSTGGNYGADGGFIELDSRYYGGPIRDINIHHNYSEANEGFMEVTSECSNLTISNNISDDYQQFIFFWAGDSSRVENNTVLRTRPANASVNVVFTFKNSGFDIRNNIFIVGHGLQVFGSGAYDARNFNQVHEANVYFSADGTSADPIGMPRGKYEIVTDPKFADPGNRNYQPTAAAFQNKGASLAPSYYKPVTEGRKK